VLPLALHVDYWDYIGWKDIFADPAHTRRQKGYARVAGRRMIYTPQMVIMGQDDVVGADGMELAELIAKHQEALQPVAITVQRQGNTAQVTLQPLQELPEQPFALQLVRYTPLQSVEIKRGELAGHHLEYANVVSSLEVVAQWDGQRAAEFSVPVQGKAKAAVIVQAAPYGRILAAQRLD
jgi:hypothetical protein